MCMQYECVQCVSACVHVHVFVCTEVDPFIVVLYYLCQQSVDSDTAQTRP